MKKLWTFQRCAVANYYYELSDHASKNATVFGHKGKYFCLPRPDSATYTFGDRQLALHSDRVWMEEHGEVKFVKHRYINLMDEIPVDLKEFMWIKLKAKTLA